MKVTGIWPFSIGLIFASLLCASRQATAANVFMLDITGTGPRTFYDTTIWPSGTLPTTADQPVIDFGDGISDYVYFDTATEIQRFNVGNVLSGGLEIRSGATLTTNATGNSQSNIGPAGVGYVRIKSGATLMQAGLLNLGLSGGTGTLTLENGGTHTVGSRLVVGGSGTGTYNMLGGSLTTGTYLQMGSGATGNGAFKQSDGALLINHSSLTQQGMFLATTPGSTGLYEIGGGSLNVAATNQGVYNGSATIAAGGFGTFRVIGSAPTITIGTHYSQRTDAMLDLVIDAGGISPMNVGGNVALDGVLGVSFTSTPTIGQQFTILNYAGTLTGTFPTFDDLVDSPAGVDSVKLSINYGLGSASAIVLTVDSLTGAHPGDFDSDGDVDGADFVAWQTNFPTATGATLDQGDADGDGDVDGADFVVWQTNFPFTPGPGVSAVPEPHSWILFGCTAIGLFAFRRGASVR